MSKTNLILTIEDEEATPEDRSILQPDGSRACVNWELRGGYSFRKPKTTKQLDAEDLKKLSPELRELYRELGY